jgi:hypothetical protein
VKKTAAKRAVRKPAATAMPAPSWAMPEPAAPAYDHVDDGHGSGSGGDGN